MAAKLVMVAVPAVLGIASIRVYTVSDVSTDGLVTREKLNIYTPVTKSSLLVPDQPGLIENGVTTAREGLLPFVHAVKGACVSVKRGSINLYHAGEDVYYYLKNPPPGFLPRFGTITMAGLLGMFLAHKGSRLKRIAVPLGLISAGASVCYPSQAVVVFKVTGKKMYAAGQWSRAAVSSLLTSKSSEPVISPQPQAAPVQPHEAAVVDEPCHASERISDAEAESVECVAASDKLIIAITAEGVPVTQAEISAEQVPAETDSETTPPTKDLVDPVQCEEPQLSNKAPEGAVAPSEDVSIASEVIVPAFDAFPTETMPVEPPLNPDPETGEIAQSTPAEVPASTEEPPTSETTAELAVAESSEVPTAAAEKEQTPEHTPLEHPAVENNKGDSCYKPDPALLDFGQSNPEDEDLYSTRS
ncbi:MICOS complex subunit MIC27 isoform X1 [Nerophis ophidion]|uniref:MICOS complex subunit MIC27 isoform X1 n=1 Tax=Nerophis ophidion TaxID=159077 RepID=UPI002AE02BF9|nr:MICOS complex subunit MIC27 isoform X1 [Nerophis ophidion]